MYMFGAPPRDYFFRLTPHPFSELLHARTHSSLTIFDATSISCKCGVAFISRCKSSWGGTTYIFFEVRPKLFLRRTGIFISYNWDSICLNPKTRSKCRWYSPVLMVLGGTAYRAAASMPAPLAYQHAMQKSCAGSYWRIRAARDIMRGCAQTIRSIISSVFLQTSTKYT